MLDRSMLPPLLAAYIDGDIPLYELRGRFNSGGIQLRNEIEDKLYRVVSMHLAMYTAGTWPEATLPAPSAYCLPLVVYPYPLH